MLRLCGLSVCLSLSLSLSRLVSIRRKEFSSRSRVFPGFPARLDLGPLHPFLKGRANLNLEAGQPKHMRHAAGLHELWIYNSVTPGKVQLFSQAGSPGWRTSRCRAASLHRTGIPSVVTIHSPSLSKSHLCICMPMKNLESKVLLVN